MRLTILAGLIVGVSLAFQSAHAVHAKAVVGHVAGADRAHANAPWYTAMDTGHRGQNGRPLVDFDVAMEAS
jgi:hypothetical protein